MSVAPGGRGRGCWAAPRSSRVLVWRLGTGPFLDGLRTVDGCRRCVLAADRGVTTVCCAWRWRLVARGLGVELPLRARGRGLLPLAVPQHRRCPAACSATSTAA